MSIDCNILKEKLYKKIGKKNFKMNTNVIKIKNDKNNTNITDVFYKNNKNNKLQKIKTKKLIIATTIGTVQKLLPKYKIYKNIKTNSFIRIYAKFNKNAIKILNNNIPSYTIMSNKLQKIIPINKDKGIYMIGYSDNKNADILDKKNNKKYYEDILKKEFNIKEGIKIDKLKKIYWKTGTHYYLPLKNNYKNRKEFIKKAQHPEKNIYVVGECIALDQGWCEGALNSVKNIENYL